jgi:hypothetical protein
MHRTGSSLFLPSSSPLSLRARAPVCRSNHPPLPRLPPSHSSPSPPPLRPKRAPPPSSNPFSFHTHPRVFPLPHQLRTVSTVSSALPLDTPQAGPHLRGSSGSSESQAGRDRRRVEVRPPDLGFPRRGVGVRVGPFVFAPPTHAWGWAGSRLGRRRAPLSVCVSFPFFFVFRFILGFFRFLPAGARASYL